jgi:hypothetical protein
MMKTTEMIARGALNEPHLTELLDQLDPAIGEASSVMGALATEVIRRSLRGGVLQIGRELSGYVAQQVELEVVEQRPLIEKTAAEMATEVARGEVDAVRQAAQEQDQQLAARIDETARQAHDKIDTVARTADDTRKQTQETTAALAQTLQVEVAAVETRTLGVARKELSEQVEAIRDSSRQATMKIKQRLDKLDAANAELADLQRVQKQELLDAWRTDRQQLLEQIDELCRARASLAQRLEILEQPRGLRRLFAWLFRRKKQPAAAEPQEEESSV